MSQLFLSLSLSKFLSFVLLLEFANENEGIILQAMENGEWLLVDGANRCSAAVLDRLNSLMEPNGSIFLSERGSIDGNILEIKPHPDFRLILTVDPAYGEISRYYIIILLKCY